jgi:hypothetical protein
MLSRLPVYEQESSCLLLCSLLIVCLDSNSLFFAAIHRSQGRQHDPMPHLQQQLHNLAEEVL